MTVRPRGLGLVGGSGGSLGVSEQGADGKGKGEVGRTRSWGPLRARENEGPKLERNM